MLIDTHAHLDFSDFDADRARVFEQMRERGIMSALLPGVSPAHWSQQIAIAKQYDCYFGLGIHPWYCQTDIDAALQALDTLMTQYHDDPKWVAVGECGLDKLREDTWPLQIPYLTHQLKLAHQYNKPVILHAVKAHQEMLSLLSQMPLARAGVVHGFTGSIELAKSYLKLGFKLGIGGVLLNENAKKLHETVAKLPLDSFVLETDSPSMRPMNAVEKRNTPLIIVQIIAKMADLQKKSNVLISERLCANAMQLFDL